MAQANNEMLEDALKRDNVRARNVGWGRQTPTPSILDDDARSANSLEAERPATPGQPMSLSPNPLQGQEGRFFKFRFGNTTPMSAMFTPPNGVHPSHLSSASLPSLSSSKDDEIEKLAIELEKRKKECETALEEKKKVEDELESLSQALFEEVCVQPVRVLLLCANKDQANKMVAEERMRVADLEAELRERASEHEALKLAMKILEEENQRFRNVLTASQVVRNVKTTTSTRSSTPGPSRSHSRHSSKSSLSISAPPHISGSPPPSPRYLTPGESESPWVSDVVYPGKTPTVADFLVDEEIGKPRPGTRSPPPPLDIARLADSPCTPDYSSAPPEATEPGEGASDAQLTT